MESCRETFNAFDLSTLILRPEIAENGCSISYRLGREAIGADKTIRISSAKNKLLCSLSRHSIPLISGQAQILIANGSIARTKTSGDRGHPCRVPLQILKGWEEYPLSINDAFGISYNIRRIAKKCLPNP